MIRFVSKHQIPDFPNSVLMMGKGGKVKLTNSRTVPGKRFLLDERPCPKNIKDRDWVGKRGTEETYKKIDASKKPLLSIGDAVVYFVDGNIVMMEIDMDFDEGGNDHAYPKYIPYGEVWIDDSYIDKKNVSCAVPEYIAIACHELVERKKMDNNKNLLYDNAHEQTNKIEHDLREGKIKFIDVMKEYYGQEPNILGGEEKPKLRNGARVRLCSGIKLQDGGQNNGSGADTTNYYNKSVALMNQYKNLNFVNRALIPNANLRIDLPNGGYESHLMSYDIDKKTGETIAYPMVVQRKGEDKLTELNPDEAYDYAKSTGEYITLPKGDKNFAEYFTTVGYKYNFGKQTYNEAMQEYLQNNKVQQLPDQSKDRMKSIGIRLGLKGGAKIKFSATKAKEMLENPPHSKKLTPKQKHLFQAVAHGWKGPKAKLGGTMHLENPTTNSLQTMNWYLK